MQYFNIQVASQLSGVASATIRAWEKRYNAVVPERADNKHRLYSEKDIEKLAVLYRLTEVGQSIGKIAHLPLDELKSIYSSLLQTPIDEIHVVTPHHDRADLEKILNSLTIALNAFKLDIISHEIEKAKHLLSPRQLSLSLLAPFLSEVKLKIMRKEITESQMLVLNKLISFHLGQILVQHLHKNIDQENLILITSPPGNSSEADLLLISLLLVNYGIPFILLGPNLSPDLLSDALNVFRPKTLIMDSDDSFEASSFNTAGTLSVDFWVIGKRSNDQGKFSFFEDLDTFDHFLKGHVSGTPEGSRILKLSHTDRPLHEHS